MPEEGRDQAQRLEREVIMAKMFEFEKEIPPPHDLDVHALAQIEKEVFQMERVLAQLREQRESIACELEACQKKLAGMGWVRFLKGRALRTRIASLEAALQRGNEDIAGREDDLRRVRLPFAAEEARKRIESIPEYRALQSRLAAMDEYRP